VKDERIPLMQHASRVLYVCRRYNEQRHYGRVSRMLCADCRVAIAVTPDVLRDRRRIAREAGVDLAVVCDDCGVAAGIKAGASVVSMPSQDEIHRSAL
jgi:hypothetical protein